VLSSDCQTIVPACRRVDPTLLAPPRWPRWPALYCFNRQFDSCSSWLHASAAARAGPARLRERAAQSHELGFGTCINCPERLQLTQINCPASVHGRGGQRQIISARNVLWMLRAALVAAPIPELTSRSRNEGSLVPALVQCFSSARLLLLQSLPCVVSEGICVRQHRLAESCPSNMHSRRAPEK
jgi:hypothetical protein